MPGFSGGLERLSACPTGARNHNYARLVLPGVAWCEELLGVRRLFAECLPDGRILVSRHVEPRGLVAVGLFQSRPRFRSEARVVSCPNALLDKESQQCCLNWPLRCMTCAVGDVT
jgi:hypothetical protein